MRSLSPLLIVYPLLLLVWLMPSCKHDPLFEAVVPDPVDTFPHNPNTGVPCDADTVYFQSQVLPLLISHCTEPGCHGAASAEEGVVLDSYIKVTTTLKNITSTDPNKNELLEVILEDDPDKRMPQPPRPPLSAAEIQLIQTWIAQGAKNNGCNTNFAGCDSTAFTWSAFVQPLIQTQCQGCHSGSAPQGGINLGSYAAVKAQVTNGKLYASVTRSFAYMPKGGNKLDDCTINRLKSWIDAGAPEN
jgi:hypothetical protein